MTSLSLFKPEYRQKLSYHTLLLGGFALLASAVIAIGDRLTRADISLRQAEDLQDSLSQVVPPELHDNDLLQDVVQVGDPHVRVYRARRDGAVRAVAFERRGAGYGGSTIVLVMGVDTQGNVLGVRVISHAETPGLGDKIELAKSDWITSFDGLSLNEPPAEKWAVKKDGGEFDQFTGATITPRTVVQTVKGGLEFFATHRATLLDQQHDPKAAAPKPAEPATQSTVTPPDSPVQQERHPS